MALEQVHPLVIRRDDGEIIDVSLMNEKSYTKSLERDELWHLHRDTGRVLPYNEKLRLASLKGQPSWYEARVRTDDREAGAESPGEGTLRDKRRIFEEPAALRYGTPVDPQPAASSGTDSGAVGEGNGGPCSFALERLEETILQRKATLPEGSYTTHLFNSGDEKIRKKTGEEAVELILARDEERIVSEAADLVYHLMVLLAFHQIPVAEVCGELLERAGSSAGRRDDGSGSTMGES